MATHANWPRVIVSGTGDEERAYHPSHQAISPVVVLLMSAAVEWMSPAPMTVVMTRPGTRPRRRCFGGRFLG